MVMQLQLIIIDLERTNKGTYIETYGTPRTELRLEANVEEIYEGLLLGYRYHFPFGLYLGGGLLYLNNPGNKFFS